MQKKFLNYLFNKNHLILNDLIKKIEELEKSKDALEIIYLKTRNELDVFKKILSRIEGKEQKEAETWMSRKEWKEIEI